MNRLKFSVLVLLISSALGLPASAADDGFKLAPHSGNWEARIGGGIYDLGLSTPRDFSGGVVNAEVLAPSLDFLSRIGSPRPYVGTDISISDDAIHFVYAGLNWEAQLLKGFYLGFSAGGSINSDTRMGTRDLGSRVLFHLQASAGFDITETVTAQAYINHFSNADLGRQNDGLETGGLRLGFRF